MRRVLRNINRDAENSGYRSVEYVTSPFTGVVVLLCPVACLRQPCSRSKPTAHDVLRLVIVLRFTHFQQAVNPRWSLQECASA